ncbi:hypothetical protein ACIPUB_09915 [Paeniglutamicibacter sp. ORCA_105]|uniref:hypothetical protein n=1 Tax=Paeniglutamicibacter sp. ORCA_105 TaxID=3377336 RepID=UPI003892F780
MISIEAARINLTEATEALDAVQAKVKSIAADHRAAVAEVERLTALITAGDRKAMDQITDARAQVDGLHTFLTDLRNAQTGARQRHAQATAQEQRARAEQLDVKGLLTADEIATMWEELGAKVDALHFPILDKLDGHKAALQELGALVSASDAVLGGSSHNVTREGGAMAAPSALVEAVTINGHRLHAGYPSQDSDDAVKKSRDRYEAQRIAVLRAAAYAEQERQRADLARVEASTVHRTFNKPSSKPVDGIQTAAR